jgi:hypothetical protein
MKEAGNIPAHGYYDQLIELRVDLEKFKAKANQQHQLMPAATHKEVNGLEMLLAASGSHNTEALPRLSGTNTPKEIAMFGVGDAMGALDDPFLQDFLQQPFRDWPAEGIDPLSTSAMPTQLQFEWENANLFGNV